MHPLRVLYLGQKTVGLRCFEILRGRQDDRLQIAGVVSNESDDVWWQDNQIYHRSVADGIATVANEKRNNKRILELIGQERANCILAVQHPWILPREIIQAVGFRAFNMHNAKLPDYKGHNACNHAILDGATQFTSTIHYLEEEVDAGPILFEETFSIAARETACSLYGKAIEAGVRAFERLLDALIAGRRLRARPMDAAGRFYGRQSIDSLRQIQSLADHDELDRKARAFYFPPFEPAYYVAGGRRFYVLPEEAISIRNGALREHSKIHESCPACGPRPKHRAVSPI